MLTPQTFKVSTVVRRNIGMMAPCMNKVSDPIQQLFLDKIREYKSKSTGGKLVDPTPQIQQELKGDLERLATQYGGGPGVDMSKFPTFRFEEPNIEYNIMSKNQ